MKRVLGWVCGVALALVTGLWWVTATSDLALSAGLYGTPGTYKVVAGELWQVAICVTVLAVLASQAIKPRGRAARGEAHRREPSRRQKAADRVGHAVLVAVPVGLLSWIAMIAEPTS